MTRPTLPQGGLRPAHALPQGTHPGLQIHCIEAPRTDRRLSFLVSANIYCAAAAALVLVSQAAPTVIQKIAGPKPETIVELKEPPVEARLDPAPPPPASTLGLASRPENSLPLLPQPETVPDTPDRLPTANQNNLVAADPRLPISKDGLNHPLPPGVDASHAGLGEQAPVDVDFRAVRILQQVQPVYPNLARISRKQGDVSLLMTIDEQGVPTDVQMISGDPIFRGEAIHAARQWRFTPATMNGLPHAARFRLNLLFRLTN